MSSDSKRPFLFSLFGWAIAGTLLICGLLIPSWILWLAVYGGNRDQMEYQFMVPLTLTILLPLFLTHLYIRRLSGVVRWEIWFGAMQIVGWAATSWSLTWILDSERMTASNGQRPDNFVFGCVLFSFAIWFITPIIVCTGNWMIGSIRRWWQQRKKEANDQPNMSRANRKPITIRTLATWIVLLGGWVELNFFRRQTRK